MSTSNPLQPQGALDNAPAPKSRVRITVLTILGLHVVFIGGLLLQGCDKGNKTAGTTDAASNTVSALPPLTDTNYFSSFPGDTLAGSSNPPASAPSPSSYSTLPGSAANPTTTTAFPSTQGDNALAGGMPSSVGSLPPPVTTPSSVVTAAGNEHTIKKGDLIRDIAKHYGVTEKAILDANPNVKPRNLKVGDKLTIPAQTAHIASTAAPGADSTTPAATASPTASGETYVVKSGDNLTKIAKRFGVSVKQLRAVNNIKGDRLTVKQRLIIPAKAGSATEPAGNTAPPASGAPPTF
ncbi:MAG: LysM peptidoglycan-binding domain-containing protein [Verrucomicrobiales bacterium]|nr:LysM peptidoglycan-binding domain-containing protein [Verrucomicrobiales bacterium]